MTYKKRQEREPVRKPAPIPTHVPTHTQWHFSDGEVWKIPSANAIKLLLITSACLRVPAWNYAFFKTKLDLLTFNILLPSFLFSTGGLLKINSVFFYKYAIMCCFIENMSSF